MSTKRRSSSCSRRVALSVVTSLCLLVDEGAHAGINAGGASGTPDSVPAGGALETVRHLGSFGVVELRRYTIKPGEREHFARYFESYFPEAFEQLGALALGDFFERERRDHFTWLRGFRDIQSRAIVNSAFYYGPLWREQSKRLNDLIVDSDDVLLLRPLDAARAVTVLPAVDVVSEERGATGVVVAQIFAVKPGEVEGFARRAEGAFANYRAAGVREAGVLVTLEVANNFPQLPVRTDGPYLVWLGILPNDEALAGFAPRAGKAAEAMAASAMLRGTPELVVLDPAPRSRLRWLSD